MAVQVACPHCGTSYTLADTMRGKRVRCKSCEETFLAKALEEPDEEAVTTQPARSARAQDEDRPASRGRRRAVEDEEEERPRRRRREDEEEDDRRPRRQVRQGAPILLILGIVGGVVVLLGGGVVVLALAWFLRSVPAVATAPATSGPIAGPVGGPIGGEKQPGGGVAAKKSNAARSTALQVNESTIKGIRFARDADLAGVLWMDNSGARTREWFDVHDLKTAQQQHHVELPGITSSYLVTFSPDGKQVAYQHSDVLKGNPVTVWSLPDNRALQSGWVLFAPPGGKPGFEAELVWMEFIQPGHLLTVTRGGTHALWDVATRKPLYQNDRKNPPGAYLRENLFSKLPDNVAVSLDRRSLALFNGDGFDLIDATTGRLLRPTEKLADVAKVSNGWGTGFSPDGSRLAFHFTAQGGGANQNYVVVWDTASGRRVAVLPRPQQLELSAGLTWWGNRHVLLWSGVLIECGVVDAETGTVVRHCKRDNHGYFAPLGPDGRLWCANASRALGNAVLTAVDLPEEDLKREPARLGQPPPVWSFSPEGWRR